MYQDKLKVSVRCKKHPKYNPVKQGQGGIKGGCIGCNEVYEVFKCVVNTRLAIIRIEGQQGE